MLAQAGTKKLAFYVYTRGHFYSDCWHAVASVRVIPDLSLFIWTSGKGGAPLLRMAVFYFRACKSKHARSASRPHFAVARGARVYCAHTTPAFRRVNRQSLLPQRQCLGIRRLRFPALSLCQQARAAVVEITSPRSIWRQLNGAAARALSCVPLYRWTRYCLAL